MTRKKLNPDDGTRIALRNRLLLTIDFFENSQDFPSASHLRAIVEAAADRGDLRSLRLAAREIDAMTMALAPNERDGLEALVRERFGVDKEFERAEMKHRVAHVISRGCVASEKERRHLEDYVEMLEATGGDLGEIHAVRRLLSTG